MSFKKYDGSTWQSINPKQLKGIPYSGTLPAVLAGTKAGYLHHYKIYGNLSQNGTPSPENPIYPSECGERTENLFDLSSAQEGYGIDASGNVVSQAGRITTTPIDVSDLSAVFITWVASSDSIRYIYATFSNGVLVERVANKYANTTIDVSSADQLYICLYSSTAISKSDFTSIMLNSGSTALPYEPYGYKLPLTSGSTPVDIYLGESQTTRRIKKLVLTGEETMYNVSQTVNNPNLYSAVYEYSRLGMTDIIDYDVFMANIPYPTFISSHFVMKPSTEYVKWNDISDGEIGANSVGGNNKFLAICKDGLTSMSDYKTWLQQQYANGTPVTVWYILATPTTGTLNEPLRKISDYADTIDSTQTSAQIPTTANSTTISWGGQGLAPSEFDSIQEWVDIPTYKRVNGEWVADNSN